MSEPYIALTAGAGLWGSIRELAGDLGLSLEESRGWLRRTFVLRGDPVALNRAADTIQEYIEERHHHAG